MSVSRQKTATIGLGVAILTVFAAPCSADTDRPVWTHKITSNVAVDGSDPGQSADFFAVTRIIEAKSEGSPIVYLSCHINSKDEYRMNAGLQIDPANKYEEKPSRSLDLKRVSGKLSVGEKSKMERWYYHAPSTRLIPINRKVAKRMFNAAVKGKILRVKTAREDIQIELPEQNQVFKDFAKWCPITNGGNIPPLEDMPSSEPVLSIGTKTLP